MLLKMLFPVISLAIAAVVVQAKELDPGPQVFTNTNSSASTQKPLKRYATKEVVVYLTPSQIKALESGQAELRSQSPDEVTFNQATEEPRPQNPQLYNTHLENLNILKVPLIQDLLDNKQPVQRNPSYYRPSSYPENLQDSSKFQFFNPEVQYNKPSLSDNVKVSGGIQSEWTPRTPVTERQAESHPEQYQYWANNKDLPAQPPSPHLPYASNYDSSYVLEQENALRQNSHLEKQSALAKAEEIANSLPILIHKEVQITKHKPVPVVHRVNVPVPTPVLVPILHPYEVKVPQPYPVPVEIIKHIPVPIIHTQKTEVERVVPYAVKNLSNKNHAHTLVGADNNPYLLGWKH